MCKYCFLKISCGIIELFHLDFDRNPHVELRCKRTSRPSSSTPRTAPTASTGRRTSTSSARSWTSRTRSRPSSRTTRRSRGSSAARSGWAADKVFRFFFLFLLLGRCKGNGFRHFWGQKLTACSLFFPEVWQMQSSILTSVNLVYSLQWTTFSFMNHLVIFHDVMADRDCRTIRVRLA